MISECMDNGIDLEQKNLFTKHLAMQVHTSIEPNKDLQIKYNGKISD